MEINLVTDANSNQHQHSITSTCTVKSHLYMHAFMVSFHGIYTGCYLADARAKAGTGSQQSTIYTVPTRMAPGDCCTTANADSPLHTLNVKDTSPGVQCSAKSGHL